MGVTKKRIEMQMYAVTQSFEEGKEKFDVSLYNFYQLANNKMVKTHWDPYLSIQEGKEIYSTGFQNQRNALFLALVHLVSICFMVVWKILLKSYNQNLS